MRRLVRPEKAIVDPITDWLKLIKPGYEVRFAGAFHELGINVVDDLKVTNAATEKELQLRLKAAGAKPVQLKAIKKAMLSSRREVKLQGTQSVELGVKPTPRTVEPNDSSQRTSATKPLSTKQKLMGIVVCVLAGCMLSLLGLWQAMGSPGSPLRSFVLLSSSGTVLSILSTLFIASPKKQLQRLDAKRCTALGIDLLCILLLPLVMSRITLQRFVLLVVYAIQTAAASYYVQSYFKSVLLCSKLL